MIRAFLALPLPDVLRSSLMVQQFVLPLPRKADPDSFHLTLVFLGDTPEPVLEELDLALSALRLPGFSLTLKGLGLFGGADPHTAWAGVDPVPGLIRLQAKVEHLARQAGCRVERRRFTPHVTLGRFSRLSLEARLPLERAIAESRFDAPPAQIEGFSLYRSTLTKSGSRYDELAYYPLLPEDGPTRPGA